MTSSLRGRSLFVNRNLIGGNRSGTRSTRPTTREKPEPNRLLITPLTGLDEVVQRWEPFLHPDGHHGQDEDVREVDVTHDGPSHQPAPIILLF